MSFYLEFKPYYRKLKKNIYTASGELREREGLLIKLSIPKQQQFGFGEVINSPLRIGNYKEKESWSEIKQWLIGAKSTFSQEIYSTIPRDFFNLSWGLSTAKAWVLGQLPSPSRDSYPSAVLLGSGADGIQVYSKLYAQGFRTFKWKIGVYPQHEEMKLWKRWSEQLSQDAKVRLDANGSLDEDTALEWFKFFENEPRLEFIEQPLSKEKVQETIRLSKKTHISLALDESLQVFKDLKTIEALGWEGLCAIKPCLIGDLEEFLEWRQNTLCKRIYSSALETVFGLKVALDLAMSDLQEETYAVGFGVKDFFEEDILAQGVSFKNGNIQRIHQPLAFFEEIWNQL